MAKAHQCAHIFRIFLYKIGLKKKFWPKIARPDLVVLFLARISAL